MRTTVTWMLLWLAAALPALAWEPDYILRVNYTTLDADCTPRESVVFNGTQPGPLLEFEEGGHYWVRVFNDLTPDGPDSANGTCPNITVHFHGFTQYLTPFSDGTPHAAQWPIPCGHFYDYEFKLDEGFHGPYWYHSHVGMQVMTMSGPAIVHLKNRTDAPVQWDEDIVMYLQDWYHASDETIMNGLVNETFKWLGEAQSLLVNGHAPNACNQSALTDGLQCTNNCGNALQLVRPNTRYRVQIINAGVLEYYSVALEGHNMTLFEADGTYLEPIQVDNVELGVAQRYSVLIETGDLTNQTDFWWRLRTNWRPMRVNGSSLWRYDENTPSSNSTQLSRLVSNATAPLDLNTTVYLPDEQFGWIAESFQMWNQTEYPPTDDEVDRMVTLDGEQLVTGATGKGFRWFVNNRLNNGSTPDVPYLVHLYTDYPQLRHPNYTNAELNNGYDDSTGAYPVKYGDVLDIVIQNHAGQTSGMAEAHPWHSHGAKYWDMGAGVGNFSYAALKEVRAKASGKPYKRDTSVNYPGTYNGQGLSYNNSVTADLGDAGWRLFRIKVEDPGVWLIHCHITPHQVMGMMTMWAYGVDHLPGIPDDLLNEFVTFGGGANGKLTYDSYGNNTLVQPRSYFAEMGLL